MTGNLKFVVDINEGLMFMNRFKYLPLLPDSLTRNVVHAACFNTALSQPCDTIEKHIVYLDEDTTALHGCLVILLKVQSGHTNRKTIVERLNHASIMAGA